MLSNEIFELFSFTIKLFYTKRVIFFLNCFHFQQIFIKMFDNFEAFDKKLII